MTGAFVWRLGKQISQILRKQKSFFYKLALFSLLLKIIFGLVLNRLFGYRKKKIRVFSFDVLFLDYSFLYALFDEIFIQEIYDIKIKKATPFIIDCGSNIGLSILYFKMRYPKAQILGFEPDPHAFAALKQNIAQLPDVTVINAAVYNKNEMISFFTEKGKRGSLSSSVTKRIMEFKRPVEQIVVPAVRLSDYIKKQVDFLKIDIEGAETIVLADIAPTLHHVVEIFIEYHYNKINKENRLNIIFDILEKKGFKYFIWGKTIPPFYQWREKPYNLIIYAYRRE